MITVVMAPPPTPRTRTVDGEPGRRIEWIGEQSVMDEPFVWTGMATGRFTPEQEALLRRVALKRDTRTVDTARQLGPDDLGLSRLYTWHVRNGYTCILSDADAEKVLASSDGHCFRDLDAIERDEPVVLYPPVELRLVSESVMTRTGELRERTG